VEDEIDPAAGLVVHVKNGERVEKGQPFVTLHYNDAGGLEAAEREVLRAYTLDDSPPPSIPELILALLEPERTS
jgi:pyrimidine-nucleoside phosphorylase